MESNVNHVNDSKVIKDGIHLAQHDVCIIFN